MKKKRFWRFGSDELKFIKKSIKNGLTNKYTNIFEEKISKKFKTKYAIAVNSGTSALHAALFAVGIKEGDEVIVPPLTFSATAFSVLYLKANPIFADIDLETFNVCPDQIVRSITKKTKAIITVSIFGLMPDMIKIRKIANKYNLKIIEDNAETIFSSQNKRISGTYGDLSIMSFQRSKHLTTGDGGAILTSNKFYFEKAKAFSNLGYTNNKKKELIQNPNYFRHQFVAPNYRIAEIVAAAGISQVIKANYYFQKRVKIANLYLKILKKYNFIKIQLVNKNFVHSYWTVAFYFLDKRIDWFEFRKVFIDLGGEPFYACWKLTYQEPALKYLKIKKNCPNAEFLQKRLILLKTNFESLIYSANQARILNQSILLLKNKYKL